MSISNLDNYQGYTNVETWGFCAIVSNTEWLLLTAREVMKNAEIPSLALKEWFESLAESFWEGLKTHKDVIMMIREVGTAERVNWREAAESLTPEN
jgi:hypothetical protein